MTYNSYWVEREDDSDISHFGVKGMKWGKRNPNRMRANAHNKRIKTRYENAKAGYKAGTVSEKAFKRARSARLKNLAGRAFLATHSSPFTTKVDQGRYYKYRSQGEGKVKVFAKTYGMATLRNAAVVGSIGIGTTIVQSMLRR